MAEAKVIGVLGFPVNHSQSPEIFGRFFEKEGFTDWIYEKFSFENLDDFIEYINQKQEIVGFNVTIPHKTSIIPYLDELDAAALKIGAVNTVKISRKPSGNISLKGYNTDYYGFKCSLEMLPVKPENAIVLGTGGASRAVCEVLQDLNISFVNVSRNPKIDSHITYGEIGFHLYKPKSLLINTTPVGMLGFPQENLNLPLQAFPMSFQIIDLIYNPNQTPLLTECKEKGLNCMNGSLMLQKQAERAWEILKK